MRNMQLGRVKSLKERLNISKSKQIPIQQFNKIGELINTFNSGKEAEKITGVLRSKICLVCKGLRPFAGGYIWRYK